jgi:rhomboid protease GluP
MLFMAAPLSFTDVEADPLQAVLNLCAAAAPRPWYPRDYARQLGVNRDTIDPSLERLRLSGLTQLTEWTNESGQGYMLTPAGQQALRNPYLLERARAGETIGSEMPPPTDTGTRSIEERRAPPRETGPIASTPVVTRLLLAANVGVFLYGLYLATQQAIPANVFLAGSDVKVRLILFHTGALTADALLNHEWWRLLANCFVHFGILHLGMNMFALYSLGRLVERLWGHARFLVIYLLAGLAGGCTAMIFSPHALLAGASGAICGLLGAEAVWILANRGRLRPGVLGSWTRNAVSNVILLVIISSLPGVSASAHFGGIAVGAFASLLLHWQRNGPPLLRWLALLGVVSLPVACIGALLEAPRISPQWAEFVYTRQLAPLASKTEQHVFAVYAESVAPVLGQHSSRRDPEHVQKAIANLDALREELIPVVRRLAELRPFEEGERRMEAPAVAHARLQAILDLLIAAEDYLRQGGDWTQATAQPLKDRMGRVRELAPAWQQALP